MSFSGSDPLTSGSTFAVLKTFFCSVSVGGGEVNYSDHSSTNEAAALFSTVSGNAVDSSYVSITWATQVNAVVAANCIYPVFCNPASGNVSTFDFIGVQYLPNNPINLPTAPVVQVRFAGTLTQTPLTIASTFNATLPVKVAISITGATVSFYGFDGTEWVLIGSADCTGQFTTAQLETLQAGLICSNSDSVDSMTATTFSWGPSSALSNQTIVPDVIGLPDATAQAAITTAGLVIGTITPVTNLAAPGTVLAQSPAAGATVFEGSAVNLTEALGLPVPDLYNTSATLVAPGIITAAGFVLGNVTYQADVLIISGNVDNQNPEPGSYAAGGSAIDIVVSTGRDGLFIPDILGLDPTDANTAITSLGFVVNTVSYAPSLIYPAGEVMAQNPSGGTPAAYGALVSYVISTGPPVAGETFDFEATVISQYANSPTLLQLVTSMNTWIDQTANFANFYSFVWDVDTAEAWGLDIWGKIVGVSRLLQVALPENYVGFTDGTGPDFDYQPFSAEGSWFNPALASGQYVLSDASYRVLILAKAFANLISTTVPALNQLLQNMFPGRGNAYVQNNLDMSITLVFDFALTAVELAILETSGVFPYPPGVSFTVSAP